jgi:probable phosphoglycerate mutase
VNHLTGVTELRNRYFLMRHGQSKANAAKVIVSSLAADRNGDFGLTARGRGQALTAAAKSGLPPDTVIFASGFARARETAEIVRERVGAPRVTVVDALRERYFGDWEGTDTASYETVWADDQAGRTEHGVEPVTAVLDRTTAFVAEVEAAHAGQTILLVSHGDALQILQVGFLKLNPRSHRGIKHFETAEIRPVSLARASAAVVPYDPSWPETFAALRKRAGHALDGIPHVTEHVGSTAVPDQGIAGREAFQPPGDAIYHHLYLVVAGSEPHRDHVDLRDYLRAHPDEAARYAKLKHELAPLLVADRPAYVDGKADLVGELLRLARGRG